MMAEPQRVYHLALRDLHAASGARFGTVTGWSLPLDYGDAAAEYAALRESVVGVDLSARSRFIVSGTDAGEVLRASFAGGVDELDEGRALRTVAVDDRGEIRDLALVARTGGIAYSAVGEPGQREATLERLRDHVGPDFDVRIDDRTESSCLVGIAGPASADFVAKYISEQLPARLPPLAASAFEFHGFRALAVRTSSVGEDGFEFVLAPAVAQHLLETMRGARVRLAGHTAVETARVESCIPAYVPDLTTGLSPAEADIDLLLGIPGGRERWMLSALLLEGVAVPAPGTPVRIEGETAGELRSCVRSSALNAVIGLAVVEARVALPGTAVDLEGIRATIVAKPFYRRRG